MADIIRNNDTLYTCDELMNIYGFLFKYMASLSLIDSISKEGKEILKENCITKCTANLHNGPVFKVNVKLMDVKYI